MAKGFLFGMMSLICYYAAGFLGGRYPYPDVEMLLWSFGSCIVGGFALGRTVGVFYEYGREAQRQATQEAITPKER